jgi:hypothetical protein
VLFISRLVRITKLLYLGHNYLEILPPDDPQFFQLRTNYIYIYIYIYMCVCVCVCVCVYVFSIDLTKAIISPNSMKRPIIVMTADCVLYEIE